MNLSENDARSLIRLLGECAALRDGFNRQKNYLMQGLCNLVNADSWVWALGCQVEPAKPQIFVNFIHDGFTAQGFADYLEAVEHPKMVPIASRFAEIMKIQNSHTTLRREDIDEAGLSYVGEVGALWEKADIGPLMLSASPIDGSSVSMIGLYRRLGKPNFTERERLITDVVLSEVDWLHLSDWPEDKGASVPNLFPRQRVVLNLLLEGLARKEIADQLNISLNTVSGYIKDIYRYFGVNSHVELMKKFLHHPSL